jgi:transposase
MYQAQILQKEGRSQSCIALILGVTRRTVYNYLQEKVFSSPHRRGRPRGFSKLSAFYGHIGAKLEEDFDMNAEVLFEQLQSIGYAGKISILRDYVRHKREEMTNYAVMRFETQPGQQAQVDWADAGYCSVDAQRRKRSAFIMKMGYSRKSYIEFTTSMEQSVLFRCMIHAFEYFGGIPAEILFDNMKTAFLFDMEHGRWQAHPKMAAFAAHYGFIPRRCRVRRPKTKGKVEREVRYLRHSFFPGLELPVSGIATESLNERVIGWLKRVDEKVMREHAQSRKERFEQDRMHLQSIPAVPYDYRKPEVLKVGRDCMVTFQTNRYSVASAYRGLTLEGRYDIEAGVMTLLHEGKEIKALQLFTPGSRRTQIDITDRADHIKAWREGRDQEEARMRRRALRQKQRADADNIIVHPSRYDELVAAQYEAERVAIEMEAVV